MSESSGWKMFPWVPDGIYDNSNYTIRYLIKDGMPTITIHKLWIDQGGPTDVSPELLQPWGAFPDMPPKPDKK